MRKITAKSKRESSGRIKEIVPVKLEDRVTQERRLLARGIIVAPVQKRRKSDKWPKPPGNVSDKVMERIWREERDGR
jgi:hypothetical protein